MVIAQLEVVTRIIFGEIELMNLLLITIYLTLNDGSYTYFHPATGTFTNINRVIVVVYPLP